MSLLENIDGPEDLHELSDQDLEQLAQEVREHIIDTVGEIGGHFGANLGTCELAVALHSVLDSPRDKILWDVGHQAYPHKVLTGRRDELSTIRQYGGLAPFCSIAESPHDIMGAGHASTSIGYAVGIKEGMRQVARAGGDEDLDGKVVAVIGDGAMTGGVAFEAISQAGGLGTPIVVVLNDNGMSIAPNVGALSRYFNRVRLNPKLWHARSDIEGGLTRLPIGIGAAFERLGPHLKESIKAFWAPGLWWEELDWAYMGVVDGHDVKALREALREALAAQRPVVVHIATVKGKGFAPAEEGGLEGMEKWHAAKPKSILNGSPAPAAAPARKRIAAPPPQYTQVFGEALLRECERDERVVAITAAMNSGTGLSILQKAMPERYFDVGIAEQQAILFAAGLSLQGIKPVAAIYSTFLQRAYDQIVHDVCLQRLNVVFAMDRAGLVGDDGPTHHGAFDIAYLRCLPNIVLMAPRDEAMLTRMLRTALEYDGPIALRYPRGEAEGIALPPNPEPLKIGSGEILQEAQDGAAGRRVALIGYGSGVGKALQAAEELRSRGVAVTVADARFAKPIDAGLMAQLAAEHDLLVTVEEGVLAGGFGSAVWETLNETGMPIPRIMRIGLPDSFITHGKPALLHRDVGFTGPQIAERVAAAILDGPGDRPGSAVIGA